LPAQPSEVACKEKSPSLLIEILLWGVWAANAIRGLDFTSTESATADWCGSAAALDNTTNSSKNVMVNSNFE
jgi:hypothetical protein